MVNVDRIESIAFDLKQSIEDFSNELKIMAEELNELNRRIVKLEGRE